MKLIDTTPYAAKLMKNISPRGPRMMGCVIVRVLHDVRADGELSPIREPQWPVGAAPVETRLGRKGSDKPFYMGGIDVLLGGAVHQKNASGRLDVELSVGRTFRRRIAVFGDRRWVRRDSVLVAGEPAPFVSMRLDDTLSFGGRAPAKGGEATPYGPNPRGRGYYLDEASAEGNPLPNLEDPNQMVIRWDERPIPVGLGYYPEEGSLRPQAAIDHPGLAGVIGAAGKRGASPSPTPEDLSITADNLGPMLFNQGHPANVIPAEKAPARGDWVRLSHGRKDGSDLAFLLVDEGFHLHVQLEDRERVIPLHLDQIGIIAGEARVLLSYRVVFEYRLVKGERRVCSLHEGRAPEVIPAHYRRDLRDEWEEDLWGKEAAG